MSDAAESEAPRRGQLKETERVQAGPGPGRGPIGGGMAGREVDELRAVGRSGCSRRLRARAAPGARVVLLAVVSVVAERRRPEDPRPRHRPHLRRRDRPTAAAGHHPAAGGRRGSARSGDDSSPTCSSAHATSCPARASTSRASGTCCCSCWRSTSPSSLLVWLQGYMLNGVVQRTVLRLRTDVEDKLNRLPLRYFDKQPRGELLSRVTNDIDNVSQTLQQTLSQLLTSLLTVVGVLAMMFSISPLLALVALVTVPLSMVVTGADREALAEAVRRSSGGAPAAQRAHRGDLHRPRAGQGVRPPARGRARCSREENDELYKAQLRRAVRLRADHAGDDVHREPQLRRHRRARRPPGRQRAR